MQLSHIILRIYNVKVLLHKNEFIIFHLTKYIAYIIIIKSLCTAYKSTVQTEQAMNPYRVCGAGLETAAD